MRRNVIEILLLKPFLFKSENDSAYTIKEILTQIKKGMQAEKVGETYE